MQNNSLSLLGVLCLSTALWVQPAFAQDAVIPEIPQPSQEAPAQEQAGSVDVMDQNALDFASRSSLGSMELTALPGLDETLINGPTPMGESLSQKDMPSEQLLGRITTEVFQEMADLERGNVFLKLEMQKEQLKNDLENLKAKYRQSRLEEIAEREKVVRARIDWWQSQEAIRLEMEQKKAETLAVEKQIAEAEELRNKLRAEALGNKEAAKEEEKVVEAPVVVETTNTTPQSAAEAYSLLSVIGVKGNMSARIKTLANSQILTVKEGQNLPTGHKVVKITKDSAQLSYNGRPEYIFIQPSTTDLNAPVQVAK